MADENNISNYNLYVSSIVNFDLIFFVAAKFYFVLLVLLLSQIKHKFINLLIPKQNEKGNIE